MDASSGLTVGKVVACFAGGRAVSTNLTVRSARLVWVVRACLPSPGIRQTVAGGNYEALFFDFLLTFFDSEYLVNID